MSTTTRYALAAALVAVALYSASSRPPAPPPAPDAPALELRGTFVGPSAAADAAGFSALCLELAACIEYDGKLERPHLTTGVAFDDLRTRARDLRLRGESLGDRHPRARDAVAKYLDATVGTSGGPVTAEARAAWVAAYRTIAEAAAHASR